MNNAIELRGGNQLEPKRLLPLVSDPLGGPPDDRLDLRSLLTTLRRHRKLFFIVMASVVVLGILATALQTRRYLASVQVVLNTNEDSVAPKSAGETAALPPSQDIADTEAEVMRSRELAIAVAQSLNLYQDPAFNPLLGRHEGALHRVARTLGIVGSSKPIVTTPEDVRRAVIDALLSGLTVQRVGLTYAFNIQITTTNPVDAQRIANEYAKQYTQVYLITKRSNDSAATSFLSQRLGQLRDQAQADTARVQQYRIANNLLSTSGASLTEQEISTYNEQVAAARAQAAEDQARLSTARAQLRGGSKGDDVGEALNSSVVGALRARRAEVGGRLASLQARYGDLYPDVAKTRGELADVDAQISAEIKRVISNLEAKATVSRDRLDSIESSLGSARGQLASNNRAMVGLDDLQRRAEASQQLYDSYLARYKETGAQEGTERPEARVTSYADLPTHPVSPKVALNLLLAVIIGGALGLAATFFAEMLYAGLTTATDVETLIGIRCLGSIPTVKSVLPRSGPPINSVIENPHSAYAEAFRNLRASIRYAVDGPRALLLVTSALPREGKTTLSTCMARLAALNGERTVLVDLDVRQRGVSRFVRGNSSNPGLIQVLRGEATLDEALVVDEPSGAMVLTIQNFSGELGDLMTGPQMDALLDELRARFSLVVLDAPPVLPIADTRSLAAKSDAVIMVARWRSTPDHAVRAALRLLPSQHVPIAGIVLTQVDIRKQAKYGYGDGAFYYDKYKHYYA